MPTALQSALTSLTAAGCDRLLADHLATTSSWWGHVPLARLLVSELQPRSILDLGSEDGLAFSAFRHAVQANRLTSRCYAVASSPHDYSRPGWRTASASDHEEIGADASFLAGRCEVLADLFAHDTIDLLHLGGTRPDHAVEELLRIWLPRLSDSGVVLIHDILEPAGENQARLSWQKLSRRYPSFEFHHDGGLGVLAPRATPPAFVKTLAEMAPANAAALRSDLMALAERWRPDAGTPGETDDRAAGWRDGDQSRELDALRQQLDASTQEADRLRLHVERIRTSLSWRATGPYRIVSRLVKRRLVMPPKIAHWQRQQQRDLARLVRPDAFDASFYLGRECPPGQRDHVVREYLAASRNGRPRGLQNPGLPPRRPLPGFHQLAYAAQCSAYDETRDEDPLAHYLRSGKPDGPWKHPIIRPSATAAPGRSPLRILIHAHFHYPDLLPDLLRRLRRNASAVDLLVTTTSDDRAAAIESILATHGEFASILVVPNLGRNIGPLLMHFDRIEGYDVVGHLHGKRSPQQTGAQGDNWRTFLWDHLSAATAR